MRSTEGKTQKGSRHTQKSLRDLRPKEDRYEVGIERGLLLEVHPTGEKTWRYRYRFQGRRPKLTLGRFATTDAEPGLTLQAARIKMAGAEKLLRAGKDPLREAKEEKQAQEVQRRVGTFAAVAESWRQLELRPANKAPKKGKKLQDEVYLERDILPRLGHMLLAEIELKQVWECINAVSQRGHKQAATKVRNVIKRVFDHATLHGYKGGNPAAQIRKNKIAPKSQRSRALDSEEIPKFLDELYSSSMTRTNKLVLHLLLLVPVRKCEWTEAPWSEFDLDRGTWELPAERTKTGVAIKHKLPRQALSILKELKRINGDTPWLFATNRGNRGKHISKSCINAALKGLQHGLPRFSPHDLRRSVRTGMGDIGIEDGVAEKTLNHNKGNVYDRSARYEVRAEALQAWADYVEDLWQQYVEKKFKSEAAS